MVGKQRNWRRSRVFKWQRRGSATVEMAIVSPILLALMFGIMEYGWVFMVQSSLTNATRDACRVGILPGSTDTDITTRFDQIVSGLFQSSDCQLQITRSAPADPIQSVTVRASLPWSKASLVGGGLLPDPRRVLSVICGGGSTSPRSGNMVATCSMMKEG